MSSCCKAEIEVRLMWVGKFFVKQCYCKKCGHRID